MKITRLIGLIGILVISAAVYSVRLRAEISPSTNKVAIIGLVAVDDITAPLELSRLSLDFAALLAGRGGVAVTSEQAVRKIIGAAPHDEMLASFTRYGRLAPYQTQRLMAANLPATLALLARIDADTVEFLPLNTQNIIDTAGEKVARRERLIYLTRRTTQLSATLLDLRDGHIVWTRQYRVTPETSSYIDKWLGQNLATSVAATVGDKLLRGADRSAYPAPAELHESVLALLQEVAYAVPID